MAAAVHEDRCHVNGRISTVGAPLDRELADAAARAAPEPATFGVPFPGHGYHLNYRKPDLLAPPPLVSCCS